MCGATWEQLDAWLGEPVRRGWGDSDERPPESPPSEAQLVAWQEALAGNEAALALLRRDRGLTPAVARRYGLGWDDAKRGYVLPIRDEDGRLVNVSWRAPKGRHLELPGPQRRSKDRLTGQRADNGGLPLYPMPPTHEPWWLLAEGEWDALLARQKRLPAFTGLLGKQWNSVWDRFVVGRSIAVAYDVGAEEDAAATVEQLRAAGTREAWIVPLGLPDEGEDIGDWFVRYGRSADELRAFINGARRPR